jgi:hypothetical protein
VKLHQLSYLSRISILTLRNTAVIIANPSQRLNSIENLTDTSSTTADMSYADAAAKGPKQSDAEVQCPYQPHLKIAI